MNYVYTSTGSTANLSSEKEEFDNLSIPERLRHISEERNRLLTEEGSLLEKGLSSLDPNVLMKANSYWQDVQKRESSDKKALLFDPNQVVQSLDYKSRPSSLTFATLRKMARQTPAINSIIKTRKNQVANFAKPQRNKYEPGFIIKKKIPHFSQDEAKLTKQDEEIIQYMTNFIINCGESDNAWHGDTFEKFLRKITGDSLEMDAAAFEVPRNRRGKPIEFFAVDGSTFRIADSYDDEEYQGKSKEQKNGYLPSYVQVIDEHVYGEFYPWELCYGRRNDSTDIYSNGYGRSELEDLIHVVTWMLYGDQYNGKFFSQGSAPKGLIKVAGNVNSGRLAQFRQQWQAMVSGVNNAWKVPVIESDKMEWIDLQKTNNDMQFGAWQEYLVKIACAVYTIAPDEIGFKADGVSGSGPLFEGSNEQRIKYSRDKGLRPLLSSIQSWINKWIINAIDPNFEFEFVGLDTETEKDEVELDSKKVSNFMGYKEIRRKNNLPEELEEGDLILNPQFIQAMAAQQQAEMMGGEESNEVVDREFENEDDVAEDQEDYYGSDEENSLENMFLKSELSNRLDKWLDGIDKENDK